MRKDKVKRNKRDYSNYRLRKKKFFGITGLMIFLFCVFQFMGNSEFYEYPNPTATLEGKMFSEHLENLVSEVKVANSYEANTNAEILVISEEVDDDNMEISSVLETLEGMKILHQKVSYRQASTLEINKLNNTVRMIILCGKNAQEALTKKQLDAIVDRKISLVYIQMPSAEAIEAYDLKELLGIYKLKGRLNQKGMRFVDDIFIGGMLDLEELQYSMDNVSLEPSCKVYAYGLNDIEGEEEVRNEDLPPIVWRNSIEGSKVFVINGKFFEENKGYGILTAILSDVYEDLLYPIINASVMIYDSIPYDGQTNEDLMMKLYSRDSLRVQTDILLPNIAGICKRLHVVPTFFSSAESKLPEMSYFERSVLELDGDLIYHEQAQVKVIDITNREGRIWDESPNLPVIVTGFKKNDNDMTKLYSIASTFGIVVHRVDISEVLDANTSDVDWVRVSKDYSRYIAYYQDDFGVLDSMTATNAAIRSMEYMIMEPSIRYSKDKIDVSIENMPETASFILRTDKKIQEVKNGNFKMISEGIYIIQTNEEELSIQLEENDNLYYKDRF